MTLENSISRALGMNVFGCSQAGETRKFVTNLEQTIKSYCIRLDKFGNLLEENHKSIQTQEEQVETLQLTCDDIQEHLIKIKALLQNIKENTDKLKQIPEVLSSK